MAPPTTVHFNHGADHCPVPADRIYGALDGAGMDATCVSRRDLERMGSREVAALLADLEGEDDPEVVSAAQDAMTFLCPGEAMFCGCAADAFDAFLHAADTAMTAHAEDVTYYAVLQRPDLTTDATVTGKFERIWTNSDEWRTLRRLERASTALRTSLIFDDQRLTIEFVTPTGPVAYELVALGEDTAWDVMDWQGVYQANGEPDPIRELLDMDPALFHLVAAITHSDVDFQSDSPSHTARWFDHPLVLMLLKQHGITAWPAHHHLAMAALADAFTGTLAELKSSVEVAMATAGT